MGLQDTRKNHTRGGRITVEVLAHAVPVLEDDAVGGVLQMVCVVAGVFDERHVEHARYVQAFLLRKEDVLTDEVGARNGRARLDNDGDNALLLVVEIAVALVRVRR